MNPSSPPPSSPPRRSYRSAIGLPLLLAALMGLFVAPARHESAAPPSLRALIVGGGPRPDSNEAGIESNVRYVSRLLPSGARQTILFADGNPNRATVQYEASARPANAVKPNAPLGERAFTLLFEEEGGVLKYRPPKLPRIDGPSQRPSLLAAFDRLKTEMSGAPRPLLLYFTGHGGPATGSDWNTSYHLWGSRRPFSVRELVAEVKKLPEEVPVTLVMVQCFSGGFGNVLFEGGDPQGQVVNRDFAGFFASTPDRMSAGCTPTLDESEYKDFTSYFFAALSGKDRVGRTVTGMDYNRDGRVGMDEAFAYTVLTDDSIDVPTSTSEVFLRRFVKAKDGEVMKTPYADLVKWANPAQLAALEGLSGKLKLSGEGRLDTAYRELNLGYSLSTPARVGTAWRRYDAAYERHRSALLRRWPVLVNEKSSRYPAARAEAVKYLESQARAGALKDLMAAAEVLSAEDDPGYSLRETRLLRFVRLGKTIVLAHRLQAVEDPALQARWKRLLAAEARTPF
ncbi:MAG: hypothetical protein KY468_01625 [Armatimonadetes bacterium]|nr:hypothetical protein [Armatimonadota bacterium]